jgi:hypothetical protein
MEKMIKVRERALKNLKIADHMLTQTYPVINDAKLLLAVLENLFLATTNALTAILYYEQQYHDLGQFKDLFETKFNVFKLEVAPKYHISSEVILFIQSLKNKVIAHKKSPMEFARKDKFVICSKDYKTEIVSLPQLKKDLEKAKLFVHFMNTILDGSFKTKSKT